MAKRLADLLIEKSNGLGVTGSVALLEMMSVSPSTALKFLTPHTSSSESGFTTGNHGIDPSDKRLGLTFSKFMNDFVRHRLTGSCGQTSEWLDAITSKDGKDGAMIDEKNAAIISEMNKNSNCRWYCRITSGGHSFFIERSEKGNYYVYQSFHGQDTVQTSVQNILTGKHCFSNAQKFFADLATALQDVKAYSSQEKLRLKEEAFKKAQAKNTKITQENLQALADTDGLEERFLKSYLSKEQLEFVRAASSDLKKIAKDYAEQLEKLDEQVTKSDMNRLKVQKELFHGKQWVTSNPAQYRLNLDVAAEDKVKLNIEERIEPNKEAWAKYFKDTNTTMKQHLHDFGILH